MEIPISMVDWHSVVSDKCDPGTDGAMADGPRYSSAIISNCELRNVHMEGHSELIFSYLSDNWCPHSGNRSLFRWLPTIVQ